MTNLLQTFDQTVPATATLGVAPAVSPISLDEIVNQINRTVSRNLDQELELARLCASAESLAEVHKEEFFSKLKMSPTVFSMHCRIGTCSDLYRAKVKQQIPSGYSVLYQLTFLTEEQRRVAIEEGELTRTSTRQDVLALRTKCEQAAEKGRREEPEGEAKARSERRPAPTGGDAEDPKRLAGAAEPEGEGESERRLAPTGGEEPRLESGAEPEGEAKAGGGSERQLIPTSGDGEDPDVPYFDTEFPFAEISVPSTFSVEQIDKVSAALEALAREYMGIKLRLQGDSLGKAERTYLTSFTLRMRKSVIELRDHRANALPTKTAAKRFRKENAIPKIARLKDLKEFMDEIRVLADSFGGNFDEIRLRAEEETPVPPVLVSMGSNCEHEVRLARYVAEAEKEAAAVEAKLRGMKRKPSFAHFTD